MLPKINTILYATDLKEKGAKNAFKLAVSLAQTNNAQLVIVHVVEAISSSIEGMIGSSLSKKELMTFKKQGLDNLQRKLNDRVEKFRDEECTEIGGQYPRGEPIIRIIEGQADEVILSLVRHDNVDLIVMGTRTHSAIGQILLGSTANKVIHHSSVPVVVYPL